MKKVKRVGVKRIGERKKAEKKVEVKKDGKKSEIPTHDTLESLLHQKEEIETFLSSLEDAYNEAAILEEDYNDIKAKNEKKLEEINKRIEALTKRVTSEELIETSKVSEKKFETELETPPVKVSPPSAIPEKPKVIVTEAEEVKETTKKEEKPKKLKEEKPSPPSISQEDLKKLEVDLAEKIKSMVEEIGAKVTEKDLIEMKNAFVKYETEIDRIKAQIDAVRESRKVDDEKIQRVIEGLAEIRTLVYGREASAKEQEIKIEKMIDVISKIEPEKILLEMGRRDKEINNLGIRITKLEETTKEMTEMLKRIEMLLRNIGSLEHVINISNEASETFLRMQNIERNMQKMFDKVQGLYAELSKRMEEFMLYRAKQDRMEDLLTETIKNVDELMTKSAYFITKDDLEAFRATLATEVSPTKEEVSYDLASQKEEIEIFLKTLDEEFKNKSISKEEYEKLKKANIDKLKEIESKMKASSTTNILSEEKQTTSPQPSKEKKEVSKESKEKNEALLKDLEDSFKKGFISKEAYEKTKKMLLGKK
jgi:hypothetical protein